MREGEAAVHLFVVVEGVGVAQLSLGRGLVSLGVLSPGDVAGWSSLMQAPAYPASVKALTAMKVARIEAGGLALLMDLEASIGYPVQRRLSAIFYCQYEAALRALRTSA